LPHDLASWEGKIGFRAGDLSPPPAPSPRSAGEGGEGAMVPVSIFLTTDVKSVGAEGKKG
ncbi:MAG: hypothetical protein NTV79_10745, partial [Candidatus Aureabacteria bacterium]|nr:hypothetical protein [Candidatus Auribacterota bacterium]